MKKRTTLAKKAGAQLAFLIYLVVEACFVPPAYSNSAFLSPSPGGVSDDFNLTGLTILGKQVESAENLYVMQDPLHPFFLKVVEKLPGGGFGRLLRFRGFAQEGRWADIEFIYEDKENRVTILDHGSGRFFRTTFAKKRTESFCLFPSNDEKGFKKESPSSPSSSVKFLTAGRIGEGWLLPELERIDSLADGPSGQEIWSRQLVRGPPEGVIAL